MAYWPRKVVADPDMDFTSTTLIESCVLQFVVPPNTCLGQKYLRKVWIGSWS
jgi:hypothetical protein